MLEVLHRLHESDPTVGELYHEDAVRFGHDGTVMRGRTEIMEFYRSLFPRTPPVPELLGLYVHPPFVGALMRLSGDAAPPVSYVDLFEVEGGLVRSVRVLLASDRGAR